MKPHVLISIAILALLAGFITLFRMGGESHRIRRQFSRLSSAIAVKPGENPIAQAVKSNRLAEHFAEETTLDIPVHGFRGRYLRTDISRHVLAVKQHFERLSLDFHDVSITLTTDTEADVITTARLRGRTQAGETINEVRELACQLVKIDGDWRFKAMTVDAVITR